MSDNNNDEKDFSDFFVDKEGFERLRELHELDPLIRERDYAREVTWAGNFRLLARWIGERKHFLLLIFFFFLCAYIGWWMISAVILGILVSLPLFNYILGVDGVILIDFDGEKNRVGVYVVGSERYDDIFLDERPLFEYATTKGRRVVFTKGKRDGKFIPGPIHTMPVSLATQLMKAFSRLSEENVALIKSQVRVMRTKEDLMAKAEKRATESLFNIWRQYLLPVSEKERDKLAGTELEEIASLLKKKKSLLEGGESVE